MKPESPAPQPEPTLGTCDWQGRTDADYDTTVHQTPHVRRKYCANWRPEQPSQPAGAWKFWNSYPPAENDAPRGIEFWFKFAEAYAKKERERADAAERELANIGEFLQRDFGVQEIATLGSMYEDAKDEVESLRTELRDTREALEYIFPYIPCSNFRDELKEKFPVLSRKEEGS